MGAAVGFEAMPVGTPACPVSGNPALEPRAAASASLAPWTPRHHHHAPSPAICAARSAPAATRSRIIPRLALDIALPTLCVSCREPVDGEGVCAACWAKLSFIEPPFCPRLGIPFVYDPGPELLSMEAIANPPAYQRARAAVRYDDVARTLVHSLKYQDRTDLAPAMGRWMARAGQELLDEADVLVPVPLHWRRGWSRRYNQSGALARVISRQSGVKLASEALRRIRRDRAADRAVAAAARQPTSRARSRSPPERSAEIAGRRVVLIDDVLTSGATTDACARALLRAKAAQVDVLVFARVVDSHRAPI